MAPRDVSVVIPTRNRPESLSRTVAALAGQQTTFEWELIVVDDGSSPPLQDSLLDVVGIPLAKLVRIEGHGAGAARNAGWRTASAPLILFTDDDTMPAKCWIQAAGEFMAAHPDHVGIEGPVQSLPYDRLYGHSINSMRPGAYMTANMGFRSTTLTATGGFSHAFPNPHCEDLDLAYRALRHGPIGWSMDMLVEHVPRDQTLVQLARRGRLMVSEITLIRRHPEHYGRAALLSPRLFPIINALGYWGVLAREARGSARRAVRSTLLAVMHMTYVLGAVVRARRFT